MKKKRKKRIVPKRQKFNRESRLKTFPKWMENYKGKNLVRGYAKWYGVSLICAIKELRMNGVTVEEEYERQVREDLERKILQRKKTKENRLKKLTESYDKDSDATFAYIAGYTSGGAPYGVTHEEMENGYEEREKAERRPCEYDDLPF